MLERDGDDETEVRYTHEGGSLYDDLLSQRRDGASYDYLLDGLASVKQVVDSSQAIENSYSYEAFGQASIGQSDVANPYLFVGGYGVQWESTPSLYFMQARYYGPGVGRFLSEDPYGGSPQDPLSLHRYLYCANGPVSMVDASGVIAIRPALSAASMRLVAIGRSLKPVLAALPAGWTAWVTGWLVGCVLLLFQSVYYESRRQLRWQSDLEFVFSRWKEGWESPVTGRWLKMSPGLWEGRTEIDEQGNQITGPCLDASVPCGYWSEVTAFCLGAFAQAATKGVVNAKFGDWAARARPQM